MQTAQIGKKFEEYQKWLQQHPELRVQEEKTYVEHLEERIIELEKTLQDLADFVKKRAT